LAFKADTFSVITHSNGYLDVQGYSRYIRVLVLDPTYDTNGKPICDFLLVNNNYLHHISHRFQVIEDYWSVSSERERVVVRPSVVCL